MRNSELRRGVAVALGYGGVVAVGVAILRPSSRFALIDEWAYATPAFRFGSSGMLEPDRTAVAPDLIPMVLGGAGVTIFGRTMAALRFWSLLSLWALGVFTYVIARSLGADWQWAGIVGAGLIASPIALPTGLIFMSDIPFAAFVSLSALLILRWWMRRTVRAAIVAGTAILFASTIRPQGVLLAPAALVLPLVSSKYLAPTRNEAAGLLLPSLAGTVAIAIWMGEGVTSRSSLEVYTLRLMDFGQYDAVKLLFFLPVFAWLYLAFVAVAPAVGTLLAWHRRNDVSVPGLVAVGLGPILVVLLALLGRKMPYMSWGSVMAANGIGGGDRPNLPGWFWWIVTGLVGVAAAGTGLALVSRRRGVSASTIGSRLFPSAPPGSETLLLTAAAFQVLGAAPLGLALADARVGYDRYLLPVVALALPALAAAASRANARCAAGAVIVAVVLAISVVGIQDWVRQREVAWHALESLQGRGVPLNEIDGGFEWVAYKVGPGDEPPAVDRADLPWHLREFAPSVDPVWILTPGPRPGYEIVETIRWNSWIRSGELQLARRIPEGSAPDLDP